MSLPKVSVIIPTYNYGAYIREAIQSVLDQSFANFEVIVVDDGSTDNTADVVSGFSDTRIKYVRQENRGLPSARNTGIRESSGSLLAFLDADDKYHPLKLEAQERLLEKNPSIGVTYSSHVFVDPSGSPLWLHRAPRSVSFLDLVSGYPFAPSDVVMRREWAFRVGLFDESFILNSEDLDFHIRLALSGCTFVGVDQFLGYRRVQPGRIFANVSGKLETCLRALETAFSDSRCPATILAQRDAAFAAHYLAFAYHACVGGNEALGRTYFFAAADHNPTLLADDARALLMSLVWASVRDGGEHEGLLRTALRAFPLETVDLATRWDWAVGVGYLMRGAREAMWGRQDIGEEHLQRAASLEVLPDGPYLQVVGDQLLNFSAAFGARSAEDGLQRVCRCLENAGFRSAAKQLRGLYSMNMAFQQYRERSYSDVATNTARAIASRPAYLANRGAVSILIRSALRLVFWPSAGPSTDS